MTIAIASGKGGTGKTTIATNLAYSIKSLYPVELIDCDVEEPNSHLFFNPSFHSREEVGVLVPVVDEKRCISCGKCADLCMYNAISLIAEKILVFPELCHGCGGCSFICPTNAIREEKRGVGWIEEGEALGIHFMHGILNIGSPLAPPIINELKNKISNDKVTILDAPPGTSCPVVSTLIAVDYVVLVTEPTPFGFYDLKLAVEVVRKLQIPFGVIINRADLGEAKVEEYCSLEKIPILLKIPFKREYAACYARGNMLTKEFPELKEEFKQLFEEIVRGSKV
ncbi:MAG: ATP-binding protein [Halanaerobiales bacterium]|nr:ATP-binding protein [Halanaerobiales bacterium]